MFRACAIFLHESWFVRRLLSNDSWIVVFGPMHRCTKEYLLYHNLFHLRSIMHKIRTRWQRSVVLHLLPCHVVNCVIFAITFYSSIYYTDLNFIRRNSVYGTTTAIYNKFLALHRFINLFILWNNLYHIVCGYILW